MPIGIAQVGEGYILGAASHRTVITVTSAFSQIIITPGKGAIELFNNGTSDAYFGGSGVTTANGFPLYRRASKVWNNCASGWNIYVCCGSALSTELRALEYEKV